MPGSGAKGPGDADRQHHDTRRRAPEAARPAEGVASRLGLVDTLLGPSDVLGLQRATGNRNAMNYLGRSAGLSARPATVARKPASTIVQRANFAELMAFWKEKELGQKPEPKSSNKDLKQSPPSGPKVTTEGGEMPKESKYAKVNEEEQESSPVSPTISPDEPTPVANVDGSMGKVSSPESKTRSENGGGTPLFQANSPTPVMNVSGVLNTPSAQDNSNSKKSSKASSTIGFSSESDQTPGAAVVGNKTKVKYITNDEARKEFALTLGGSLQQNGAPYDTSKMYSKFMGDGYGIYVMGADGTFYSTSHKIGLFHHSSFLAGSAVAGAGEFKVSGGSLQAVTNKSGHYMPTENMLVQSLARLDAAGALGSAELVAFLDPDGRISKNWQKPGGAKEYLDAKMTGGSFGGGTNKDPFKYVKNMEGTHKGEEEGSVALVRQLIEHFVQRAREGKLRKFTAPNPSFGNKPEDIKQLVLAEFGWSEEDTVTYAAVLENWNNNKPIGEVPPPSKVPQPAQSLSSSSISTDDSGPGDGRDWAAELKELKAANPKPDWESFGIEVLSFGPALDGRSLTTSEQVQILKGEKTAANLRKGDEKKGRDYDAELKELLAANPNPDWEALGLEIASFGPCFDNRSLTTSEQVQLLKGEITVKDLE